MTDTLPQGPAPSPNQFRLLGTRRFLPLFMVQFLGAFNDQVYKNAFVALLTFRLADELVMDLSTLNIIAGALFILPFALFAATAGQIADGMDKARMMRWVKLSELLIMGVAVVAYHLQNVFLLYVVLFMMGAQSAAFAPIKYAVLPQYLSARELVGGNALVQAATFLAILLGTILGFQLVLSEGGVTIVSVVVLAVAAIGLIAAFFAPSAPPIGERPKVDWLFPRAMVRLVAACTDVPAAMRAIYAIAWFWFVGATFLTLLPAYAREVLQVNEDVTTLLLTAFSIGVALGALLVETLLKGRINYDLAPWAALGIALFSVALWLVTPPADPAPIATEAAIRSLSVPPASFHGLGGPAILVAAPLPAEIGRIPLADIGTFLSGPGIPIMVIFVALAASAGLYVTPLNAVLQDEAPAHRRAQFIACSNVIDSGFMVGSSGIAAVLVVMDLNPIEILALAGLTGLPMALVAARYTPGTAIGRVVLAIAPRRRDGGSQTDP